MKRHFPLYLKIVLWFVLNLLLLSLVGLVVLEGRFGLDLLVSGPVSHRIAVVSEAITSELRARPASEWDSVLLNRSANYGVKFLLFEDDGKQIGGETTPLPPDVRQRLKGPEWGPPGGMRRIHGYLDEGRSILTPNTPAFRFPLPPPRFVVRSRSPTRYWIGMPAFLGRQPGEPPHFATLVIASSNLYGGGLFFDAKPLLIAALWVLLFSTLFWFPLVRGITRSLRLMTRATERIAEGQFDVRVQIRRRDELGQLGGSVNRMAERLEGFVNGQKRFLGDTAHELCTPLARIQMAVGILEQRSSDSTQSYVQDVREEVQHMSDLVAELLSFSKASLARAEVKLQPIKVRSIVEKAVERESCPGANLEIEVPPDSEVMGDSDLLQRAVANLVRNALRYAGSNGPIRISSRNDAGAVLLSVIDSGPGVPEEYLQRLFDPFFRLDDARTRETGGVGLGLTIVRTCVEACGGTVSCRNCEPSGLEVSLRLNRAPASDGN